MGCWLSNGGSQLPDCRYSSLSGLRSQMLRVKPVSLFSCLSILFCALGIDHTSSISDLIVSDLALHLYMLLSANLMGELQMFFCFFYQLYHKLCKTEPQTWPHYSSSLYAMFTVSTVQPYGKRCHLRLPDALHFLSQISDCLQRNGWMHMVFFTVDIFEKHRVASSTAVGCVQSQLAMTV